MPSTPELVTESAGNGIADPVADNLSTDSNSGGNFEPEIIVGYPTESPSTERIASEGDGNGDFRRTKSGRIDGRTLRGKYRKSGNGTDAKEKVGLGSFSIDGILLGIHAMLATALKIPELEISADESKKLGSAIQDVMACYNHVVDPKVAAWIQLAVVTGGIYGTRIVAVKIRNERSKKKPTLINTHVNGAPNPFDVPVERDGTV